MKTKDNKMYTIKSIISTGIKRKTIMNLMK